MLTQPSDLVGRSGLEDTYDSWLRGSAGVTKMQVDILGRPTATVSQTAPVNGDHLVTSIDARVQAVAERELHNAILRARGQVSPTNGRPYVADSGAVVVLDARTGRVVAMASAPTYDPNIWTGGISQAQYSALTDEKAGTPLISRAYQGEFAPGSTFKAVTTAAMLEDGWSAHQSYDCPPALKIGEQSFTNFEGESFGAQSLKQAIEVSCDTVFYKVAYDMWLADGGLHPGPGAHPKEPIATMAHAFGLGSKTGLDLPGEAAGDIQTRAEKQQLWSADEGHLVQAGQGRLPRAARQRPLARQVPQGDRRRELRGRQPLPRR